MINFLNINKKNNFEGNLKTEFIEENINIDLMDYYYSNVISRSSKTMTDCRNEKVNTKKNGTEG